MYVVDHRSEAAKPEVVGNFPERGYHSGVPASILDKIDDLLLTFGQFKHTVHMNGITPARSVNPDRSLMFGCLAAENLRLA